MNSINSCISVIVPSYNRAHLLKYTLPTYLQDYVLELLLIDDCSSDNTELEVRKLQKIYPQIKYIRNPRNMKQPYSKNIGITNASGKYIYFGDDDSFLLEGSMKLLYDTIQEYDCDAATARSLCAGPDFIMEKKEQYIQWRVSRGYTENIKDVYDISTLHFNWGHYLSKPIEVPCCPACTLVKTSLASKNLFDINYVECAYREETDFFIRLNLDFNAKMFFQSKACQFNLPDYLVKNSGARTGGENHWLKFAIQNNKYFLEKNWERIKNKYHLTRSISDMQDLFIQEMTKKQRCKKSFFFKEVLKKIYFNLFVYKK